LENSQLHALREAIAAIRDAHFCQN